MVFVGGGRGGSWSRARRRRALVGDGDVRVVGGDTGG